MVWLTPPNGVSIADDRNRRKLSRKWNLGDRSRSEKSRRSLSLNQRHLNRQRKANKAGNYSYRSTIMGSIAVSDKTLRITVANWRFGNGDVHRRHQAERANRRMNLRNQEGDRTSGFL
ncbi:MAG: hypothetical protein HC879_10190 [Leptolyngbyaceae cyanobacterium SL_5_9]|nr:hypothetical protein [Leptolyngbyaceae cyanobacterium SL_5_9]NJO76188.1 hypothetical protein [Leptolyngbyaceae cyanobacterium RM1_406_9]